MILSSCIKINYKYTLHYLKKSLTVNVSKILVAFFEVKIFGWEFDPSEIFQDCVMKVIV